MDIKNGKNKIANDIQKYLKKINNNTITLIILCYDEETNDIFLTQLSELLFLANKNFTEIIVFSREENTLLYLIQDLLIRKELKYHSKLLDYTNISHFKQQALQYSREYTKELNNSKYDLILETNKCFTIKDSKTFQEELNKKYDVMIIKYNTYNIPILFSREFNFICLDPNHYMWFTHNECKQYTITSAELYDIITNKEFLLENYIQKKNNLQQQITELQNNTNKVIFEIANHCYREQKYKKALSHYKEIFMHINSFDNKTLLYYKMAKCYQFLLEELQQVLPFFISGYFTDTTYRKLQNKLPNFNIDKKTDYIAVIQKCCEYSAKNQKYLTLWEENKI